MGWRRWCQLLLGVICVVAIANLQYGWTLFIKPIDVVRPAFAAASGAAAASAAAPAKPEEDATPVLPPPQDSPPPGEQP